ncbi:MAG: hypothetical protein KDK36_21025 [Leptospiraceae bacterium]|nr:hypothetical protein [Leptospiraceae bacterium]
MNNDQSINLLLPLSGFNESTVSSATTQSTAPGISIGAISGNTNEFGNSATFTIQLNSQPSSSVQICMKSSDTADGGTINSTSNVLSSGVPCTNFSHYIDFSASNWSSPQTITITGSRGTVGVSGNTNYEIQAQISSIDSNYSSLTISPTSITNLDIDIAGSYFVRINVNNLNGSLSLTNNSTDNLTVTSNGYNNFSNAITDGSTYSVAITSQPSSQVCSISNLPYGTISSAHAVINISCVNGYLFNGTLLGSSNPPTLNQSFTGLVTLAGSNPTTVSSGNVNATGTSARFNNPIAITTDGTNLYVADIFNNSIKQIAIGTNIVTTLASLTGPHGVTTDGTNVYASSYNQHRIYKIQISTGTVTLLTGSSSGDVIGSTSTAQFNTPTYLTTDGTNLFITDRGNGKIKKIVLSTGIVSTVVSGLNGPNGITTDGTYLYIAESSSHRIRRVTISDSTNTIVAGTGASGNSDNTTGTLALLNSPYGLTMDGTYLYILEGSGKSIKKMLLSSPHSVSTILSTNNGFEDGIIGTAKFCNSGGTCDSSLTFDGSFLYFSDRFTHSIRKFYY